MNTTYVGTIRTNKRDVPRELLPNRNKVEESSIFCLSNHLTLVSYVPKRNKSVILLSSMHHDRAVAVDQKHKPDIILYYSDTKSGVDNFDHLIREYTCKRKVNRWPMVIFFNMIDCAALVSYILYILTFPNWNLNKHHKRRLFLKQLGRELVYQQINRRIQKPLTLL